MEKNCNKCNQIKSLESFSKQKRGFDGYFNSCKDCNNTRRRSRYKDNKNFRETSLKRRKEWGNKNREYRSFYDTSNHIRYRIQKEEYDFIFKKQNEVCAICKKFSLTKGKSRLCVDHCHKTGKIRGLLCDNCNKAIGLLNDDLELIKNSYLYLETNK